MEEKVSHKRIRRVSIDQFYEIATREENAFYQICMMLPTVIESVVKNESGSNVPHDTVVEELRDIAKRTGTEDDDLAMAIAVYMLGFNTYKGFNTEKIFGE